MWGTKGDEHIYLENVCIPFFAPQLFFVPGLLFRRHLLRFLVIADDALQRTDGEKRAPLTAHCQGDWTQGHLDSPTLLRWKSGEDISALTPFLLPDPGEGGMVTYMLL